MEPLRAGGIPAPAPAAFTGSGAEYFRIWIVNLLLSVATLGIYSAWAKVRRERWFHQHARVAGAAFDYHGTPAAILRGRLLAVGALALLQLSQLLSVYVYWALMVALALATPWVIVRALRFRLHNTSHRGLRFRFHGTTREAARTYVGLGVLSALSLGLAFP